jgi:hypothetical protein
MIDKNYKQNDDPASWREVTPDWKTRLPDPLGEHCSTAVKMWLEAAFLQDQRHFPIESAVSN